MIKVDLQDRYQVSPKMSLSSWLATHSNSWQCMMAPHMLGARTLKFSLLQKFSCSQCQESAKNTKNEKRASHHCSIPFLPSITFHHLPINHIIIIKRKWWWWLIVDDVMTWCCSYSRQSASSKQSVLTQPRSGFGEVRPWGGKRVNQKYKVHVNLRYTVSSKQRWSILWDSMDTDRLSAALILHQRNLLTRCWTWISGTQRKAWIWWELSVGCLITFMGIRFSGSDKFHV